MSAYPEPEELPPHSVELEVMAKLAEAYLESLDRDHAVAFLRGVASSAADETNVLNLREGSAGARAHRLARAWLRRNVTIWLARFG